MSYFRIYFLVYQVLQSLWIQDPRRLKEPSWIWGYFQKQMYFVSCFLEIDVFCFLTLPHPTSVGIRALTYPGLVANVWDGSNSGDRKLRRDV